MQAQTSTTDQPLSFMQYYQTTFGKSRVNFNENTINVIIQNHCLIKDIVQRKVLVLYCNNESDSFGKTICKNWFKDEFLVSLLSTFVVAGYNITTERQRNEFIQQLSSVIQEGELFASIRSGQSKIYVFVPHLNNVLCQAYIDSSTTKDQFVEEILNINDLYATIKTNVEKEILANNEIQTCQMFQQIIYDKLDNKGFEIYSGEDHESLKDKIAFAYFGPPATEKGYDQKQQKCVRKAFEAILTQSDKCAADKGILFLSIIYACCVEFTKEQKEIKLLCEKFNPVPIFIIRKCHPVDGQSENKDYCRIVIDSTLRVYTSWSNFLNKNKYPEGILCFPRNGEYKSNEVGVVLLEFSYTPASNIENKVLKGLDITAAVTGAGSGGVMVISAIASTAVLPVTVLVGAGAGGYLVTRGIANLIDRSKHEEDMRFSNAEARAAYINIVAGTLGFVGVGANAIAARIVQTGGELGEGTLMTINALAKANLAAGGVAFGNSVYDITHSYLVDGDKPSALALIQLSAAALFFGTAIYNYRNASSIIARAKTSSISRSKSTLNITWEQYLTRSGHILGLVTNIASAEASSTKVVTAKCTVELLSLFRPAVQRMLVDLMNKVLDPSKTSGLELQNNLRILGKGSTVMNIIINFICEQAIARLKYGAIGKESIQIVQLLVNYFILGVSINDILVQKCVDYFYAFIGMQFDLLQKREKERSLLIGHRERRDCNICLGYQFYQHH